MEPNTDRTAKEQSDECVLFAIYATCIHNSMCRRDDEKGIKHAAVVDTEFLERGSICIKVWGFAFLIVS